MSVSSYPLQWPANRPRTARQHRRFGKFNKKVNNGRWSEAKSLTVADALSRLQDELDRIGARYPVISSNIETRLDGRPRSGQPEPDDPGVALYFDLKGKPHCMPCDTYTRVADNIAAIAAHIEATRLIERHGVASVSEMFAGFTALPAPGAKRDWWMVLGIGQNASREAVDAAYRNLAKRSHPDSGGSHEAMAELNRARDEALKAVRS